MAAESAGKFNDSALKKASCRPGKSANANNDITKPSVDAGLFMLEYLSKISCASAILYCCGAAMFVFLLDGAPNDTTDTDAFWFDAGCGLRFRDRACRRAGVPQLGGLCRCRIGCRGHLGYGIGGRCRQ